MEKLKYILTVLVCFTVMSANAQKVTQKDNKIYIGKEEKFSLSPVEYFSGAHKWVITTTGDTLMYFINMNNYVGTTNMYNVSFIFTDQAAYINIVNGSDAELIKMLNDAGVFKEDKINKEAVNNLSTQGVTVLNDMPFKDPQVQDVALKEKLSESNDDESPEEFRERMGFSDPNKKEESTDKNNSNSQSGTSSTSETVSFYVKNNSSNSVRIFVGTKPKYGSGTTGNLGGNSRSSYTGKVGDQV